jgi:hypothetical protein
MGARSVALVQLGLDVNDGADRWLAGDVLPHPARVVTWSARSATWRPSTQHLARAARRSQGMPLGILEMSFHTPRVRLDVVGTLGYMAPEHPRLCARGATSR